jgi:hypothetical protein
MTGEEKYARMLARVAAERQGRSVTLRLDETANAYSPYMVAKTLALRGLAVFPVRGREPLTDHGVYSATCDLNVLARMIWHDADGCGLATGEVNGIDVLDVDLRPQTPGDREGSFADAGKDGFAALAQLVGPQDLETLSAQTPRNGRHFYFRHVIGSKSRKLCADGSVEWFSDRKLVVLPPAPGRAWFNRAEIVEAPGWLRALVLAPKLSKLLGDVGKDPSGPLVFDPQSDREVPREIYFLIVRGMAKAERRTTRRVRGLWRNLAAKSSGRNDGLNYTAWQFTTFVETGDLDRQVAGQLLWLACKANGYFAKDAVSAAKAREVISRVLGEAGRPFLWKPASSTEKPNDQGRALIKSQS